MYVGDYYHGGKVADEVVSQFVVQTRTHCNFVPLFSFTNLINTVALQSVSDYNKAICMLFTPSIKTHSWKENGVQYSNK
jgi:hypothetical protein